VGARRKWSGAALVAGLALAAAGCGGSTSSSSGSGSSSSASGGSTKLELDDSYFKPKTVAGKPGQKLTIELENEGSKEHNFTVDDQSIDEDVEAGENATVTVSVPQSGKVTFYCKYHKAVGMTGTIAAGGGGTTTGDDMMGGKTGDDSGDDSGGVGY
jgi:plastocyanin